MWVLQTWIFLNKRTFWTQERIRAFLGAVPNEHMVCLDLACEDRPQWSRTEAFFGKPWLWCNVQNYGRTVFLGGALNVNNGGLIAARRDPGRGTLLGVGFVNEGLGYNPVVYDWRPFDFIRDVPGEVCDSTETALPGAVVLYLQGSCGDVNFLRDYSSAGRCHEPARLVSDLALDCQTRARTMAHPTVRARRELTLISTRRKQREEIHGPLKEARWRLETNNVEGWREGIGRVLTNRPDDMIARHGGDERKAVRAMARFYVEWADLTLADWETRPETIETEVHCLRIGDLYVAANSSELFSSLALELRSRCEVPELMIAGYSNGRIGYMPDAHDIELRSYPAYQSPKYCNQFPFTEQSGPALRDAMVRALCALRNR